MQAFINTFRVKMSERLKEKTDWDRVELAIAMEAALADTLAKFCVLIDSEDK